MSIATYILRTQRDREFALAAVHRAQWGRQVRISMPTRSNEQNRRLWSMLQAIVDAKTTFAGREWDAMDWYELLASAYLREKGLETGMTVQGLAGEMLTLGRIRPSQFTTEQFAEFSDSVLAWIDQHGIHWEERAVPDEAA